MRKPSPIRDGEHPPCASCGAPITKHANESAWTFWTRRNCSIVCVNRARRSEERHQASNGRNCPMCGAEIIRKPRENITQFEARQTCGALLCVNKARGSGQHKGSKDRPMALDDDLTNWGAGFGGQNLRFRNA